MTPKEIAIAYETTLMALCIWREARSESREGQIAVGYVIFNRAEKGGWWGDSIPEVILKPWQFSCFNANDPQSSRWPTEAEMHRFMVIADLVMTEKVPSPVGNATHYYATWMDAKNMTPKWVNAEGTEFIRRIGNHKFYTAR